MARFVNHSAPLPPRLTMYCGTCHDTITVGEPVASATPIGGGNPIAIHAHCTRQAVRDMRTGSAWETVTDRWGHEHRPLRETMRTTLTRYRDVYEALDD